MKALETHPAADMFPPLEGASLQALADDIKAHGLKEPIELLGGAILDGRSRQAACDLAGVKPEYHHWELEEDPWAWVVSKNLHRRHLDVSQRGVVALALKVHFAEDAKKRQATSSGGVSPQLVEKLPQAARGKARDQAAAAVGISGRTLDQVEKVIAEGAAPLVAAMKSGDIAASDAVHALELSKPEQARLVKAVATGAAKNVKAALRESRRSERTEALAEVSRNNQPLDGSVGRHPIIYADPPWRYASGTTDPSREIENQYPTMPLEEICALPVGKVCTDDAILFLWSTSPLLTEALTVMQAWGFTYKTQAVWDKGEDGMGHWFRQRHETLLVGVRGSPPLSPPSSRSSSLITGKTDDHSEKPAEVYEIIERMYPTLPKLELFSRVARAGWKAWGNQAAAVKRDPIIAPPFDAPRTPKDGRAYDINAGESPPDCPAKFKGKPCGRFEGHGGKHVHGIGDDQVAWTGETKLCTAVESEHGAHCERTEGHRGQHVAAANVMPSGKVKWSDGDAPKKAKRASKYVDANDRAARAS